MIPMQDESTIDVSQWLGKNEPKVNRFRAQHGDLTLTIDAEGEIKAAQAQVGTLLGFLCEEGIIDSQQRYNGQMYELWQTCFRAKLGYRTNPIYGAALAQSGSGNYEDGDFAKLIFRLQANAANMIERAITTPANAHQKFLARQNRQQYQRAFHRLGVVMEQLADEAQARRDSINACAAHEYR